MRKNISGPKRATSTLLLAALAVAAPLGVSAQQTQQPVKGPDGRDITVTGQQPAAPPAAAMVKGPEVKGIISARNANQFQVTMADGNKAVVSFTEATKIRSGGLFGGGKLSETALLNGLPVTIKTMQAGEQLIASQINLRSGDLKTANMIRNGTAQGFAEQTAATEALRGRVGDIDNYNIKGTTNVNFAVGRAELSEADKAELCQTAQQAEGMKNSLLLVVGYTDITGGDDLNQRLSEKRASRVVNYMQQNCGWKPYRMLTPTGMAKADPLADNSTPQGRAQNRRVAVNIMVSKGLDGL